MTVDDLIECARAYYDCVHRDWKTVRDHEQDTLPNVRADAFHPLMGIARNALAQSKVLCEGVAKIFPTEAQPCGFEPPTVDAAGNIRYDGCNYTPSEARWLALELLRRADQAQGDT